MKSAAALIIGDEILTGKVQDENSLVLAKTLFECGVGLGKIEIISDNIDEIAQSVKHFSDNFDYVFTSGGVGSTHDDITYEAVAKAFDLKLAYHQGTLDKFHKFYELHMSGKDFPKAQKKMALLPDPCEVLDIKDMWISVAVVKNVYVLPGIPKLFQKLLGVIKPRFQGTPFARDLIYTLKYEGEIAEELEKVQESFPELSIGSYPKNNENYKVMISVEGQDKAKVCQAADQVEKIIDGFRGAK